MHASAHAEVQPEAHVGVTRVDEDLLAPPPRGGESVADERVPQRGCGRTPLHEPRVGRVHLGDLAIERARLEDLARGFDFEDLGHGKEKNRSGAAGQTFVIAPVSAPCARRAYLARNPLV